MLQRVLLEAPPRAVFLFTELARIPARVLIVYQSVLFEVSFSEERLSADMTLEMSSADVDQQNVHPQAVLSTLTSIALPTVVTGDIVAFFDKLLATPDMSEVAVST